MELISLIVAIILFCVFIGIFLRLGRIEQVLIKMAKHQGAIEESRLKSEQDNDPVAALNKKWF